MKIRLRTCVCACVRVLTCLNCHTDYMPVDHPADIVTKISRSEHRPFADLRLNALDNSQYITWFELKVHQQ